MIESKHTGDRRNKSARTLPRGDIRCARTRVVFLLLISLLSSETEIKEIQEILESDKRSALIKLL